jgi:acyl-coenzyme A thioesterase PaaI-like protein
MGDEREAGGLGLQFRAEAPGVVAEFEAGDEHRGAPGFLHGGFAAMALDETMAAIGWLLAGVHVVTATLELRYRRPVPLTGQALRLESWRDAAAGSTHRFRVHGRLLLADGTTAVEGRGLFVAAPEEMRTSGN